MTRSELNRLGMIVTVGFSISAILVAILNGPITLQTLFAWLICAIIGLLIAVVYLRQVVRIAKAIDQGAVLEQKLELYRLRLRLWFPGQFLFMFGFCILLSQLVTTRETFVMTAISGLGVLSLFSIVGGSLVMKYVEKRMGLDLKEYFLL